MARAKFMRSDGLFYFLSKCKFGSFKNPFGPITSLSELSFVFRRFILKKVISVNYGSRTSRWKPWRWVRLDLILTMRDIYINCNLSSLTKFTSNRSIEFIKISSYGASLKWSWRHKLCGETSHTLLSLTEGQWKQRQEHDLDFTMDRKPLENH